MQIGDTVRLGATHPVDRRLVERLRTPHRFWLRACPASRLCYALR